MVGVEVIRLEMDVEYTDDQLGEMERTHKIFRLRSTSTGLRDYLQRNPPMIYSLEKNDDGTLKVKERIPLGRLYDVEQ